MLFGLPCPGCGLTRATIALFTLDFPTMLAMHPLAPVIDPLLAIMLGRYLLIGVGALSPSSWDPLARIPKSVWIAIVAALFIVWGLRLFGYLGGPADPIDPEHGWATRLLFR
jgi:hypothetical protein